MHPAICPCTGWDTTGTFCKTSGVLPHSVYPNHGPGLKWSPSLGFTHCIFGDLSQLGVQPNATLRTCDSQRGISGTRRHGAGKGEDKVAWGWAAVEASFLLHRSLLSLFQRLPPATYGVTATYPRVLGR